jgi:hypothetical protein
MNWQELQKRKLELSIMKNIPSMAEYAEAWNMLAADFDAIGAPFNAEYCRGRFRQYRDLAGGEYMRLIELPFSELVQVSA